MRLTIELPSKHYYPTQVKDKENVWIDNLLTKLGQLEDIEEELGIDLITLFKALKNGVYTNTWLHKTKYRIDLERKRFEGHCSGDYGVIETSYFYFKDYGVTWALTKEELINEKSN